MRKRLASVVLLLGAMLLGAPAHAVPATGGATFHVAAGVSAPTFLRAGDIVPTFGSLAYAGAPISGGFTSMFWVRPQAMSGSFTNLVQWGPSPSWGLYFQPGSTTLQFAFETLAGTSASLTGPTLALNDWSLVTLVSVPSNALKVFVNGNLVTQGPVGALRPLPGNLYLSGSSVAPASALLGDFGLWNRALTQAEVAALAHPPSPVPEPGAALLLCGGLLMLRGVVRRP